MMEVALRTMLQSKEEGDERDGANIACIEGKAGTGKTLGYLLPANSVAKATGMTVMVSTHGRAAGTAFLPRRAAPGGDFPIPFDYKLLKGRNRYVCLSGGMPPSTTIAGLKPRMWPCLQAER